MQLPDLTVEDIMLRLGSLERQVCALKSVTSQGWETVIAWNPVSTFMPSLEPANKILENMKDFVTTEQRQKHLLIGYMSYDFGSQLCGLKSHQIDDIGLPLTFITSFDNWLSFDDYGAVLHGTSQAYAHEVQEIVKRPARQLPADTYRQPFAPTQTSAAYSQAYRHVKDYIIAGDIYQVNISQRFEGTTDNSARDLFCKFSSSSQSDFQAYIEGQDFEILSYSPERFIQIQGLDITTMPVKGTAPRGINKSEDEILRRKLLYSIKEQSELNMITDLMRNDLGAICQVGSVHVAQKRTLRAYPTLWHANSCIKGQLRAEISSIEALGSMMPGGSITGCPKKRAMEIIAELEPQQRGVYTGSIFTVNACGDLDSNIIIRTVMKRSNKLYLSVGGGIVYDSTEAREYQELFEKAVSFIA